MKYTSKPITIDAERYDPPTDQDAYDQIVSDLSDFAGAPLERQVPWNPIEGQNCLLLKSEPVAVAFDAETDEPTEYADPVLQLVKPGDYIVRTDAAPFVIDGGKFEQVYDTSAEKAAALEKVEAAGKSGADALNALKTAADGADGGQHADTTSTE